MYSIHCIRTAVLLYRSLPRGHPLVGFVAHSATTCRVENRKLRPGGCSRKLLSDFASQAYRILRHAHARTRTRTCTQTIHVPRSCRRRESFPTRARRVHEFSKINPHRTIYTRTVHSANAPYPRPSCRNNKYTSKTSRTSSTIQIQA